MWQKALDKQSGVTPKRLETTGLISGWQGCTVVGMAASQNEGCVFESLSGGLSVQNLDALSLHFLPQSREMHIMLINHFKWLEGV